jgi:hypothetical protein
MADLNEALAEIEDWANEPLPASKASNKPHTSPLDQLESHKGDASCLPQHQIKDLFKLCQSVRGCPMPESMLPNLPR